jgi:hypothetical protein
MDAVVAVLRRLGSGAVVVDLTEEPPTVVARAATGLVFAAAWPTEEGVALRLRLLATQAAPGLEHVSPGSLGYEALLTSPEEVADAAALLDLALEAASKSQR